MTIEKDEGVSNESGKTLWVRVSRERALRIARMVESYGASDDARYLEDAKECDDHDALTQQLAQLQAQNAELVNEVAGHHFVRNERDRLLEQNTAIQSRCEGLERALDIARIEQERFAAQSNKFAEILGGILHIIPPDFVTPDGKIMQFVPPDPLAYLRALANSISKAYAALSPSGKAGEGASRTSELERRVEALTGRWVPWKPGDKLPAYAPVKHWTTWFDKEYTEAPMMRANYAHDFVRWGVTAYWSIPLPPPYSAMQEPIRE